MDSNSAQEPEIEEVLSDGLTLDLTNSHLPTLQDVPLPPTLTVKSASHQSGFRCAFFRQ